MGNMPMEGEGYIFRRACPICYTASKGHPQEAIFNGFSEDSKEEAKENCIRAAKKHIEESHGPVREWLNEIEEEFEKLPKKEATNIFERIKETKE